MEQSLVIYKYDVLGSNSGTYQIPKGYKVLTAQNQVQNQNYGTYAWIMHRHPKNLDELFDFRTIKFYVIMTGSDIKPDFQGTYINTVQTDNGFVFHIFYEDVTKGALA